MLYAFSQAYTPTSISLDFSQLFLITMDNSMNETCRGYFASKRLP